MQVSRQPEGKQLNNFHYILSAWLTSAYAADNFSITSDCYLALPFSVALHSSLCLLYFSFKVINGLFSPCFCFSMILASATVALMMSFLLTIYLTHGFLFTPACTVAVMILHPEKLQQSDTHSSTHFLFNSFLVFSVSVFSWVFGKNATAFSLPSIYKWFSINGIAVARRLLFNALPVEYVSPYSCRIASPVYSSCPSASQ